MKTLNSSNFVHWPSERYNLFYVYYVKCMFTLNCYYNFYIPILFILINLLSKFWKWSIPRKPSLTPVASALHYAAITYRSCTEMCDLFKPGHPTMVTSPCPPLISRQLDTVSVPDMVLFLLSLDNDWPASGPDLVSLPLSLDNGHLCLNIDWLTLSLSLRPRLPNV